MGKKDAYSGMSPKDVSTLAMDRFIKRNERKNEQTRLLPSRRKDQNIPVYMWPLKDQIEHWKNQTEGDLFREKYPYFSMWYDEVRAQSGVYPLTFIDYTSKLMPEIQSMYAQCVSPRLAVLELRKYGVY
jgi:hypothetical protein